MWIIIFDESAPLSVIKCLSHSSKKPSETAWRALPFWPVTFVYGEHAILECNDCNADGVIHCRLIDTLRRSVRGKNHFGIQCWSHSVCREQSAAFISLYPSLSLSLSFLIWLSYSLNPSPPWHFITGLWGPVLKQLGDDWHPLRATRNL